jgi:hypothetical protein
MITPHQQTLMQNKDTHIFLCSGKSKAAKPFSNQNDLRSANTF